MYCSVLRLHNKFLNNTVFNIYVYQQIHRLTLTNPIILDVFLFTLLLKLQYLKNYIISQIFQD